MGMGLQGLDAEFRMGLLQPSSASHTLLARGGSHVKDI